MRALQRSRGLLNLVVGPSGAGKDSVIAAARRLLEPQGFIFPRRVITRSADAGGELHEPATRDEFERRRRAGDFCLSWEAHGLGYGIPAAVAGMLEAGHPVVVNVSRAVVDVARVRLAPLRVVQVTAPPAVLAERLRRRGRESAAEIIGRLARADAAGPLGPDVVELVNDGPLDKTVERFIQLLMVPPVSG